ncbi:Crp/Fnr family transcriptional regulator [Sandarakinorhabdus limnophila]|uniref:Crp/Fnr family transcriptional regulator n=1 Tax=Sandarakinorhabdus limnophila TaxID=210512 RepID=UPI0026EF6F87|nr:Crp/Fnr family transcriptional regulator [Sandarakinorhabdus limnophila]MCM0032206.1 Crp/Fnr family transcriptional regulator [Sandarakinorhabdus limnophila]
MVFGTSCKQCGVRGQALCGVLADEELAPLAACGVQRSLARGETLVHAGDQAPICANIQRGLMKISHINPAGQEVIVGLLWPGDFVGTPFAGGPPLPAAHDIVALTPVSLCQFPQARVERTMVAHPAMERALLSRTLAELGAVRTRLSRLARATALARVAGFITESAHRSGVDDGETVTTIELPLSRGEMADLLGLTIETVSRQMTRLKNAGVIGLPGGRRVEIHDPDALAEAAEELV